MHNKTGINIECTYTFKTQYTYFLELLLYIVKSLEKLLVQSTHMNEDNSMKLQKAEKKFNLIRNLKIETIIRKD